MIGQGTDHADLSGGGDGRGGGGCHGGKVFGQGHRRQHEGEVDKYKQDDLGTNMIGRRQE